MRKPTGPRSTMKLRTTFVDTTEVAEYGKSEEVRKEVGRFAQREQKYAGKMRRNVHRMYAMLHEISTAER